MHLEPATPRDLPKLLLMVADLSRHHGDESQPDKQGMSELLWGERALGEAWMIWSGEDIAGFAITAEFGRFHLGTRGLELIHLYIAPAHRGGAGREAMRLIEIVAAEKGLDRVILTAGTQQVETFYEGLGYARLPPPARYRRLLP